MKNVSVKNMTSAKGNKIANQFIIETKDGFYFQSYQSIIAFEPRRYPYNGSKIQLDKTYWDYSVTTGRYRNMFLGETKAETEKKIASGEYELTDLN